MASLGTPKSIGQPIGSVVRCKGKELDVKTKFELHNGDGLSYFNDDGIFEGFRINSADGNGNGNVRLRLLNSVNIKPGTQLFRTYDKQFEKRKKLFEFNKSVNLPVCLDDLNIKKEDIPKIAARANGITEWSCVPYEVTEEKFVQAVLECDEAGQAYR